MGAVALAVGVFVALLTMASQTGLLGGHDFGDIAAAGLLGVAFTLVVGVRTRSRAAVAGLVLSLLPLALLVYYLSTTDG